MKSLACACLTAFLLAPCLEAQTTKPALTIEAIAAPDGITGRSPENIQWSPDHARFSFIQRDDAAEHGQLWSVDAASGEKTVLLNENKLAPLAPPPESIKDDRERERITRYHVEPYQWSPDTQHLLFNAQGQLWLYGIASGAAVQFTSSADPILDPKFSPDGGRVAYVRNHNLYARTIAGVEKRLTEDKDENLLNGEVDWVYAEELSARSNYFWSPNGKDIVFLQMNETRVPTYPITSWMPTHPKVDMEKYPKAGDPNPEVRLGVVSTSGGKVKWISLTDDTEAYIPRFGWVRDGLLWAEVLNRTQDNMDLYFVDVASGKSRKALSETSSDAWVNVSDDFRILKSGDRFLWPSWRDGHTHLYLYSFDKQNPLGADARLERQITQGDFEMLQVAAVDENDGVVYFIGNQGDSRQHQIYSVKLDGSGLARVSQEDGTHDAIFANDGQHYVDEYSALLRPPRMSACSAAGSCRTIVDSRSLDELALTMPTLLDFKAQDGTMLHGQLLLPSGSAAGAKIPLIVNVYGGPALRVVRNSWTEDWPGSSGLFQQFQAQHGFAVFSLDNRGTPERGRKFGASIRHQFGAIELQDQLAALNQLLAQYPQLDRSRVGIWGWSNGGSMTLYALTHSDVFKAGVAVSPVTDWRNYDSIYTERLQGQPKENFKGYDDLLLSKVADKLHGALLLMHGTSDDNVHFQNSIQMADALIQAGKPFHFMAYPNKTHSIAGAADRAHLFHMIEEHFEMELK